MSQIIDLDILVSEEIKFKVGGVEFAVPTSLNTQTVINLMNLEQKMSKAKKVEEQLILQDEMVLVLFSQLNDVNNEWVSKLSQSQKAVILNHYKQRMFEINSNPNSESLPSQA